MSLADYQRNESGRMSYSTQRRQFRSCDRCRRGRRACDAVLFGVDSLPGRLSEDHIFPQEPCTGCRRLGQVCTFDWLKSLPLGRLPKSLRRILASAKTSGLPPRQTPSLRTHRQRLTTTAREKLDGRRSISPLRGPSSKERPTANIASLLPTQGSQLPEYSPATQAPLQNFDEGIPESIGNPKLHTSGIQFDESVFPAYDSLSGILSSHQDQDQFQPQTQIHTPDSSHQISLNDDFRLEDMFDVSPSHSGFTQPFRETGNSFSDMNHASSYMAPTMASDLSGYHHHSRCNIDLQPPLEIQSNSMINRSEWNLREFSPCICHRENTLSQSAGRKSVVNELFQIYQGSFENAMSCWVTPQTCPYKVVDLVPTVHTAVDTSTISFLNRVSSLDKVFSHLCNHSNGITQSHHPSKALRLAIMAFSSQWTHDQGNGRSDTDLSMEIGNSMEFEKLIQQSLWNEAKTALELCSDVTSFRYILAQLIFALTKRPLENENNEEGLLLDVPLRFRPKATSADFREVDCPVLGVLDATVTCGSNDVHRSELSNSPTAPSYMGLALHSLLLWRRKLEAWHLNYANNCQEINLCPRIAPGDVNSFYMLFWFGVMCDTTSSVLYCRPSTLSDADTSLHYAMGDIAATGINTTQTTCNDGLENSLGPRVSVWGSCLLESLRRQSMQKQNTTFRWPCDSNQARQVLQNAIPVKVLLWRKIFQMQKMRRDGCPTHRFEKCVREALQVHNEWQTRLSMFFNDCLFDHVILPFKIKSWYVILGIHWNLACLYLADCIDDLCIASSFEGEHNTEWLMDMAFEIRKGSTYWIAGVAKLSHLETLMPSNNPQDSQPAFNGALLTEPWSDVLVESLASASRVLLSWIQMRYRPRSFIKGSELSWLLMSNTPLEIYDHIHSCILALELFGCKSDIAKPYARSLRKRLEQFDSGEPHQCL